MKITQRKKGEWIIDFTLKGKRIRRVIKGTKRMAEEAMTLERERIYRYKYGISEPKKRIRIEDYIKIYIDQYEYPKSLKNILSHTKTLSSHFKGKFLDEITPGDIEKFKNKRKKEVCNASVNRGLSVLKSMYTKVVNSEDYGIVRNPVKKISLLDEKSERKRILSDDEPKRLLHSAKLNPSKNLYLFLIIVLNTGTRKMETLSLKWENVDFSKRILKVLGKGGKWREIPMNDIVIEELTKRGTDGDYVFFNPKTGTFIRNIGKIFMRVCRDAKINNLTIHDLRHTAASHLVNDCGIDIVTASKILGHSNILMTVKYIHPTDEHKRIAVDRLGEIFKKGRKKVDKRHVTIPAERSPLPHMKYH